jgi:hypothetical protein
MPRNGVGRGCSTQNNMNQRKTSADLSVRTDGDKLFPARPDPKPATRPGSPGMKLAAAH